MKNVGQIFREERKRKGFSINKIVEKTRIPKNFLTAIETNQPAKLPKGLYPKLYVKRYAKFLGLPEEKMVAIFRRDYLETKREKEPRPLVMLKFLLNWQKLAPIGIIFLLFAGYLLYQYLSFVRPPSIKLQIIDSPTSGKVIKGKTNPQASLKIEGEAVLLDPKGNFSYQVKDKEKKEIIIIVESPAGNKKRIVREL